MTEAYDGRQVVGIDLHRRRSVIVRMTEDGRKLETVRITSSPAALRAVIARAGKNPDVVIEATYGWYWAVDVLEAAGAEVRLAHPLGVKAFSCRRVKNDERDAADLADLLRMGRLPEAWIAPAEIRELRELTRYRHKLVKARTSCKDQVHGVLAKLGVPVTHTDIFGVHGQAWLDELPLPQPYAGKVASLRQLAPGSPPRSGCWSRYSATCWPGTRDTPRSSSCRASARCWPRSSWPRSATSAASPVPGSWAHGPG
jgi:transposase